MSETHLSPTRRGAPHRRPARRAVVMLIAIAAVCFLLMTVVENFAAALAVVGLALMVGALVVEVRSAVGPMTRGALVAMVTVFVALGAILGGAVASLTLG